MIHHLLSSISTSRPRGGGGEPIASILPDSLTPPVLWFSAESVTVDGSGGITAFISKGIVSGVTATPTTGNLATVIDLNGKPIINIPNLSSGGYVFPTQTGIKTVVALATYGDGTTTTFSGYDGFFSGSFQATGDSGKSNWFNGQPSTPVDNGVYVASSYVVLPLNNRTIGAKLVGSGNVSHIFRDNDAATRNWYGTSGDILMFDYVLTDAELLTLHDSIMNYYGLV